MKRTGWPYRLPLYVRLAGGLGNQISTLALAIIIARSTGRKILIDSTKVGSPTNFKSKDQRILDHLRPKNVSYSYINKTGFRSIFVLLPVRMLAKFRVRKRLGLGELRTGVGRMFADTKEFNGFVAGHYEGSRIVQEINIDEFEFLPFSTQFLDLVASAEKIKPIAVHIRLGDFRTWQGGSFVLPPEHYASALGNLRKKELLGPVWIFSDDDNLESAYMSLFESPTFIQDLSDFEQLCLIARCNGIIASKSSFSWWACNWSAYPENVVFPIQDWMKPNWFRNV